MSSLLFSSFYISSVLHCSLPLSHSQGTLLRTPGTPGSNYNTLGGSGSPHSPYLTSYNANGTGTLSPGSMHSLAFVGGDGSLLEPALANSPVTPTREALIMLHRPKTNAEKARINGG